MISHFNIREAIVNWAKKDPKIQKITNEILNNFVENTKKWWFFEEDYLSAGKTLPDENNNLSVMDLYYTKEIEDNDLSFLSWILGGSYYVRKNVDWESYITPGWFAKLNSVLNKAFQHARRNRLPMKYFIDSFWENWMNIMDVVEPVVEYETWKYTPEHWKINFHIKTKEQYLQLLKKLTNPESDAFLYKEFDGMFSKYILSIGFLWRNEAYSKKRRLFQYANSHIFWKFFNHKFWVFVDSDTHGEHWNNVTETFVGTIGWKDAEITLKWNVKYGKSTVDKLMREKTANATNDIIRYQLIFSNHKELVTGLYEFLEFYLKNPWHVFNHEWGELWQIKCVDKWWLESENKYFSAHIDSLPEWQIKDLLQNKDNTRKWGSSKDYKDVKLIVPVNLEGTLFNIEIKFVTKDYELFNDRGYASHSILKWAEMIESICRHKKYITENEIKKIVDSVIQQSPELIDQISKWNEEDLHEELFDYFINKCEKISIPWHKTVYMFKDIKDTLTKYSFWPHIKEEDN